MSRILLSAPRSVFLSSLLIAVGLSIELLSLFFVSPFSFTAFLAAVVCIVSGSLIFLVKVVRW